MPFIFDEFHIFQVGARNLSFEYEIYGVKFGSVQCVKDLSVTTAWNLKFSQQCKNAAGKANRMLDLIKRNFSFKYKEVILSLYINLIRPHLDYAL